MKYKTKQSFTDHLTDAKYTYLLVVFIILCTILIGICNDNNMPGLANYTYYVLFLGGLFIIILAYFKRYYEDKNNISEPIRWSITSISLILYILFFCFSRIINYKDDTLLNHVYSYIENDGLTTFIVMLPVLVLSMILIFKRRSQELGVIGKDKEPNKISFLIKMLSSVLMFCFPIFIIYVILFATDFEKDYPYTAIILTIMLTFILISIGMIIFKITKQKLFPTNKINTGHTELTFINLIKYTVLYIPCLITEFIDYLKYEYSITTKSSLWTLGITSGLIASYIIIPQIRKYIYNFGSTQMLEGPIYINKYTKLGSFENIESNPEDYSYSSELNLSKYKLKLDYRNDKNTNIINTNIYNDINYEDDDAVIDSSNNIIHYNNYTYCISFWVNINPQPPNTGTAYNEYVSIFNYGKKPEVLYKASKNFLLIKMIQGKDGEEEVYKSEDVSEFKLQKWNHFCINYDKGTLDIFLNNKLIASRPGIVPYTTTDVISCGSAGGIEGGICNIRYYNRILSKSQIYTEYESFKDKNPPVI
tara:strand:- start:1 stop:1602 length:1602 start_codon:yes stop_codon:yes gene_type:complete